MNFRNENIWVSYRMPTGNWDLLEKVGNAPPLPDSPVIICRQDDGSCFAFRLTHAGWEVITEPVSLYQVMR